MTYRYKKENWIVIYRAEFSELHPAVATVGGYGVYFGDSRDVAEPLPTEEVQTNNFAEFRAALAALGGHIRGTRSLNCPDSTYVVDGVLERAQKWRHHKWQNILGPG